MQNLDEIVIEYLKTDTDYALMITGKWGVGKTHYFKNVLKSKISEIPTKSNASKKYKPILISLFGIKSIEDLQTEILLALVPLLNNKVVKLTGNIWQALTKGILKLNQLGAVSDYFSNLKLDKEDWINFGELVICFDDLERKSDELDIKELIGYINSLVENENVKILIIANENEIGDEKYNTLREKVVGNIIEFNPELDTSFDSLISSKFPDANSTYLPYLQSKKAIIIDFFKPNSVNLRILAYALACFRTIYSELLIAFDKENALKNKQDEIFMALLKFTIAVSIEYREGEISFTKRQDINASGASMIDLLQMERGNWNKNFNRKEEDKPKSYRQIFRGKYYKNSNYTFFDSVYGFITGGSILKLENLIQELKSLYNIYEMKISPQYELFNKLYSECMSMSDREYYENTRRMLVYCDEGSYELVSYLTIFYLVTRFDNPLRFKLTKLENRIIKGMKRGITRYKYNSSLDFHMLHFDSTTENIDSLVRIKEVALKINEQLNLEKESTDYAELQNLFYSDIELFSSTIFDRNGKYTDSPIFKDFNSHKFYLNFLKSNNATRLKILNIFERRYYQLSLPLWLKPEIKFIESLKTKIIKKKSTIPNRGPANFLFTKFGFVLENLHERINVK